MTTFDKRERAEETKFKHDQEFRFKVVARRNKLLGLWAAEVMGLADADAAAYARQVVASDFERPGDDDVLEKVLGDLNDKGHAQSELEVRHQMDRLLETAKEQVASE